MHEKCKLYYYTVHKFCGVEILTSHLHPTKQIITISRAQANRVFPAEIRARSSHQRWPIHCNNRHLRRHELQSYWPEVVTSCDATSNLCTCVQLQRRYDHYSQLHSICIFTLRWWQDPTGNSGGATWEQINWRSLWGQPSSKKFSCFWAPSCIQQAHSLGNETLVCPSAHPIQTSHAQHLTALLGRLSGSAFAPGRGGTSSLFSLWLLIRMAHQSYQLSSPIHQPSYEGSLSPCWCPRPIQQRFDRALATFPCKHGQSAYVKWHHDTQNSTLRLWHCSQ